MIQYELFPPEVTTGAARIIITGNERAEVEQHRGLIRCETECISLKIATGVMVMNGRGLTLRRYTSTEAVITGSIESIALQPEGRRE